MDKVLAAGDWSQVDGLGYVAVGVVALLIVIGITKLFKR